MHHVEHFAAKKETAKQPVIESNKQSASDAKLCYRCGDDDHLANECKYFATVCNYCKTKGHLERVCRKKERTTKQKRDTHYIDDVFASEEPVYVHEILHVEEERESAAKFLLQLRVNGKQLVFEVDTGSPVSVISAADQRNHFPHLELGQTSNRLVSYCGAKINVLGKTLVDVISDGDLFTLPLYVVESVKHPLLGREWLLQMRCDLNRVFNATVGKSADN